MPLLISCSEKEPIGQLAIFLFGNSHYRGVRNRMWVIHIFFFRNHGALDHAAERAYDQVEPGGSARREAARDVLPTEGRGFQEERLAISSEDLDDVVAWVHILPRKVAGPIRTRVHPREIPIHE